MNWADPMSHTWLILCGALVMFMQAGFAMVESGSCRAKNVQNILMKNLVDVCIGTLCWWATGWAFAYGFDGEKTIEDDNGFMGYKQFFTDDFMVYDKDAGSWGPGETCAGCQLSWFFQWAFCSAAATIVSGGVAERVNFPAYGSYTILMTAFIYPVVVGWTWSVKGWLNAGLINDTGFMDFAGSGIVHMTGGVGALVGAAIAGPRKGRFDGTASETEFDPHSLPLIVLGTFILWFGWYGFNCGSTLGMGSASTGVMAAHVAVNTTLSAATGGLGVLVLRFAILKKYDIGGMCNGILAGLVSITAGCGNLETWAAFIAGLVGACVYEGASRLLKLVKVDDPIDAFAVHGAAGAWGVFVCAFLDWGYFDSAHGWSGFDCYKKEGETKCNSDAWGEQLVANIVEILAIAGWVAFFTALVFVPLRLAGILRSDDETQDKGQDAAKHSPSKAYSMGESAA